jgi:hypothetical protein
LHCDVFAKSVFSQSGKQLSWDIFISYCWANSAAAVEAGTRAEEGSLGHGDPRALAKMLMDKGYSCWLDINCAGKVDKYKMQSATQV